MTNFKSLRVKSGLSVEQCAKLICSSPISVRHFEMNPDKKTARKPPELALKVLEWWIDGEAPYI